MSACGATRDATVTVSAASGAVGSAYGALAKTNNTMIVPGNMSEVSALIGTAMTLLKQSPRNTP
jgi:NADPH-dependent curcumin reductase CurA